MLQKVLILLILVSYVLSDTCVTYTFEDGYPDSFVNDRAICSARWLYWGVGTYKDRDLTPHNELGTKFIYPLDDISCVSSFMFPMRYGGKIEVNIYMENPDTEPIEVIEAWVNKYDPNGEFDEVLNFTYNSPMEQNSFVSGWYTLLITLNGEDTNEFTGYLSFMGMAANSSVALIDSFRYIPAGTDEDECIIYPLKPTTDNESSTDTTELPTTLPGFDDPNVGFWTPLRKVLFGLLLLLAAVSLCGACFCCCRPQSAVTVMVR